MGIVALAVAIVGFIFACIPGALIVGWILLPIAFLLAIISFFLKGGKGLSIAALIISVVGTIVALLVFFVVVASAFDDAFSEEVSGEPPAAEVAEQPAGGEQLASGDEGTRANPYPLGTVVKSEEWEVTITDVTLDATDEVMAADDINEEPESGNQYMLIDVEVKYVGSDPDGSTPMMTIDYVSASGNTFSELDTLVIAPDELRTYETLYEGASASGSLAIEVPSEDTDKGVLAVSPDMFADSAYVAVK